MSARRHLLSSTAGALALAVFFSAAAVHADEPRAPPSLTPAGKAQTSPEPVSVPAFGDQDPACLEWTDSCRVCARDAPGEAPRCSTPGPVCQPGPIVCARR
jgi:hypothetical protein